MKLKVFMLLAATTLFADKTNLTQNASQSNGAAVLAQAYELPPTVVSASSSFVRYLSGNSLNKNALNSAPNGNGDLTSALKILPNVQFDAAQLNSHTAGEIDPASVSISGGLFYQNNFLIDGFNANNDLDPIGGGTAGSGGASQGLRGGRSQGFNIDTSLLENISLLDSNIGAAYGGFTGGVVEASVRNPRTEGWHFDINYQFTSDKLTQQHINEKFREAYENSTDEKFQPNFSKHLIKASVEGWVNEKLGVIGAFSTTRSYIPLNGYTAANQYFNPTQAFEKRDQKRVSDNYYLKAIYKAGDAFSLEANLGYMPQFNTYFNAIAKDSFYTMQNGGWQAGLKGLWETKLGLWSNQLGYSLLQNSRKSDKNYFLTWRHSAGDKNWAATSSGYSMEGGVSSVEQKQQGLNYKSDMQFERVEAFGLGHKFRVGGEIGHQNVNREIVDDYYYNTFVAGVGYTADLNGAACGGFELFGVALCSAAATTQTGASAILSARNGQYIKALNVIKKSLNEFSVLNYAFYAEDDVDVFDLQRYGALNARLGLRFDGDDYMKKSSVAPRFSLSYLAPWRGAGLDTKLTFGANRYYGRNLFSYKLYDSILAATKSLTRENINSTWVESEVAAKSQYAFDTLRVPYSDEVAVGLSQSVDFVSLDAKYISRQGRDEIVQRGSYANWHYTNEGRSKSSVVSLSVQNTKPLKWRNFENHFLLAFDYTSVERGYNPFAADETYIENPNILYDGRVIKYSERPVENFALPWTLRLSTTHKTKFGFSNLALNNFFRYRSGYERMVRLTRTSPNWDAAIGSAMAQYGKHSFKGAFTWDVRVGLEFAAKSGVFYVNVDVLNLLNTKSETTISGANGNMAAGGVLSASAAYAVYDVGRQFWLQFGYKY